MLSAQCSTHAACVREGGTVRVELGMNKIRDSAILEKKFHEKCCFFTFSEIFLKFQKLPHTICTTKNNQQITIGCSCGVHYIVVYVFFPSLLVIQRKELFRSVFMSVTLYFWGDKRSIVQRIVFAVYSGSSTRSQRRNICCFFVNYHGKCFSEDRKNRQGVIFYVRILLLFDWMQEYSPRMYFIASLHFSTGSLVSDWHRIIFFNASYYLQGQRRCKSGFQREFCFEKHCAMLMDTKVMCVHRMQEVQVSAKWSRIVCHKESIMFPFAAVPHIFCVPRICTSTS